MSGKTVADIDGNIFWCQPNGKVSAFVMGLPPQAWGWIDYERRVWYLMRETCPQLEREFDREKGCWFLPWAMIHNSAILGWEKLIFSAPNWSGRRSGGVLARRREPELAGGAQRSGLL